MKTENIESVQADLDSLITVVRQYAQQHESQYRFEHSVRTAETCEKLCRRFGLDARKGYLAGIAHDICKEFSKLDLVSLAIKDGAVVSPIERTKISLLHGRAAAVFLTEQFGITDEEIIEAVRNHIFGKAGIGALAKVLFVADKTEPAREHVTEAYLKKIENLGLDELVVFVLSENIAYLTKRGKDVAPASQEFLESLVG